MAARAAISPGMGYMRPRSEGGAQSNRARRAPRPARALDAGIGRADPAHADIPVVQVDGRIAVARHQQHLVAELRPRVARRDIEHAVLVGGPLVDRRPASPSGTGMPQSNAQRLVPGIDDGRSATGALITVASTNSACSKVSKRLPSASLVARVVGVHEDVGAGLQLVVDAARRLDLEGAGAGAADDRAGRGRAARSASTRASRARSTASRDRARAAPRLRARAARVP